MTDPALPQTLGTEIADLKRRLAALERSPQLKSASIKGGALRVLDSSDNEIFIAGEFDGGATGVRVQATDGSAIMYVSDTAGFGIPRRALPWRPAIVQDSQSTTSATFVTAWDARWGVADADGLKTNFVVTLNAADEAEIKCSMGADETDTVTLVGSTQTQWAIDLNWDHGKSLNSGSHLFLVEVRRSSGTGGNVNVWRPHPLEATNAGSISATAGGLVAS